MNLEEAKANIGAEVELDESTKPYTFISVMDNLECKKSNNPKDGRIYVIDEIRENGNVYIKCGLYEDIILPHHLKLKPQNYKIHVPTEEGSREAQELFFELGYEWISTKKVINSKIEYIVSFPIDKVLVNGCIDFESEKGKQITLQDLRYMVAKKKQTQTIQEGVNPIVDELKTSIAIQDFDSNKELTLQDVLRAIADGKDVEAEGFESIKEWIELNIGTAKEFRIKPKTIYIEGGDYTKEELLKALSEFE